VLKKILITTVYSILFNFVQVFAQSLKLSSIVKDAVSNEPLVGVSIWIDGTSIGTITDNLGYFSIQYDESNSFMLIISSVGYKNKKLESNEIGDIIYLEPETLTLDELVVTALGLERDSKDLGYAIQRIDAQGINQVQAGNFTDNLAGKFAGVTVSQGATGIGSTSKITIRGESSFTNNNPLFVVDGIPINNATNVNFTNDAAAGFQEIDFGNGAMDVNAENIENISVLKGPAAAALYGTRAANGVIVITTKNGSDQLNSEKLGIQFSSNTSFESAFQLPEFQNKYGQGNSGNFAFINGLGAGVNDNISYSWGPLLNSGIFTTQFDSPVQLSDGRTFRGGDVSVHGGATITPTELKSYPNNLADFYQIGSTKTNALAFSREFKNGNSRVALSEMQSEAIIPGVNLNRRSVSTKLNLKPSNKLSINSSLNYIYSESDNRPSNGYGSENVNYALVAWGPRSLNINALKDYWQPGLEGVQQYSFNYTYFDNPYFTLLENQNSFTRNRFFAMISAKYAITNQLNLQIRSGMDYLNEDRKFRRAFSSNRFVNGAYANQKIDFRENNTDMLLYYSLEKRKFGIDISLGANRMDQYFSSLQIQTLRLAQAGIFSLSNAASPIESFENTSKKRINSVYALSKLSFENWFFVDLTARNDWSSALTNPISADNSRFFYPSVSASFILSEKFKLPKMVSFAKIRANWAQVGNDTEPYQTSGVFIAQTPVNGLPTFSGQNSIPNPHIKPEKTSSFEIGADLRFLENRLRFDVTYYLAKTENQIISLPVAISSGYSQRVINGGLVTSRGIELIAEISPIRKPNLTWDVQFNFSENVAIVESLPSEIERLTLAYSRIYDNVNQTVWYQVAEGDRLGDMYGTGYKRNDKGDFIVDANGLYIADNTLKKLGNYNPDFILVTSNEIQYKNFTFGFLIDWRYGGILISRTRALATVAGQLKETENRPESGIIAEGVVNIGTNENPIWQTNSKAISAESYYRMKFDRNHEENNTYDATYLKLREMHIGYSIKKASFLISGQEIKLSIYGRNLWAWSKIPHFDPEQLAVQGNQFVSGVEDMSYATSRSIGVQVKFDF